ncbi:MAG TPA: flavin reductase family protein [Steroidobacteraceae bacterium]|jgi:flavin reductase (DIM6/NTAB) family NADH-FMN oxidoreductase RutF|nr:flavin reductase family protein [Steroidobacteraceae bacterium]
MFYRFDRPDPRVSPSPFKACVVPRPIGWISTLSAAGVPNLAPFSFFNAIGEAPPMVMFCANGEHIEGGEKDSVRNARETGEFVVNLATWKLREAVNRSSAEVGREIDEFDLAGLTAAPSLRVRPARVAESPVSLECVVSDIYPLPLDESQESGWMVMGRVLGIHIDDDVVVDGRVSIARLHPIARLGYREFAAVEQVFKMTRPGVQR